MIEDYCAFIAKIEEDPFKIIDPPITIGDMLALRSHVRMCDKCRESCERITEKEDKRNVIRLPISEN